MFKKQSHIHEQIKVFLGYLIRNGNRCGTYNFWLQEFVKLNKVEDVYDIEEGDIENYLTDISVLYQGQHALNESEKAVRALIRFYTARGRNLGYNTRMTTQTKNERNRELVRLRMSDPVKWSWRKLGERFQVHFTTAAELFERHEGKYSKNVIHR